MSETKKIEENNKVKIKIDIDKLFIASMVAFPLATMISSTIVFARLVEVKWMVPMMYAILILLTPIIYKFGDYIDFY